MHCVSAGKWKHWNERVLSYTYPMDHEPEYTTILVPNVDNARTDFLLQTIAKQNQAVLLIGEQGTAKTVMINNYINSFNPEYHISQSMNFSSATTPLLFQASVEVLVFGQKGEFLRVHVSGWTGTLVLGHFCFACTAFSYSMNIYKIWN